MPKRNSKNKGKESVSNTKSMNSFEESHSDKEMNTNAEKSKYIDNSDETSDANGDDVSDISDDSDFEEGVEGDDGEDDNSKKLGTKFLENVIKYLEIDDTIKHKQDEHREEVKNLKDTKGELEGYILRYLDRKGKNEINIGNGKGQLIKEVKDSKSPIKPENIREGILDGLKNSQLGENDEEKLKLINSIMDSIDTKRAVTQRTCLRRINPKAPKKGKGKDKGKGKGKGKDKGKK